MCVSIGPANFSKTIVYSGITPDGRRVFGYQNIAENKAEGPNALILPIPALPGTMTRDNFVNTSHCPHILKDMQVAEAMARATLSAGSRSAAPLIFEHDIYTVILAEHAHAIPNALEELANSAPEKCPRIPEEFFTVYDNLYPGWPIALCCFNNRDAQRAHPLLLWYQPKYPEILFVPTLDAHDGRPPQLDQDVLLDHTIIVGAAELFSNAKLVAQYEAKNNGKTMSPSAERHMREFETSLGLPVRYQDELTPILAGLLPQRIMGGQSSPNHTQRNGDFILPLEDPAVFRGRPNLIRIPPTKIGEFVTRISEEGFLKQVRDERRFF